MPAVSGGAPGALSTPCGKRGWFFPEWSGGNDWHRVRITAGLCPRTSPELLAGERAAPGERYFRQGYLSSFEDTADAVFAHEDIQAATSDDVHPLL